MNKSERLSIYAGETGSGGKIVVVGCSIVCSRFRGNANNCRDGNCITKVLHHVHLQQHVVNLCCTNIMLTLIENFCY